MSLATSVPQPHRAGRKQSKSSGSGSSYTCVVVGAAASHRTSAPQKQPWRYVGWTADRYANMNANAT